MGWVRVLLSDGMNRKAQKAYKPGSSQTEIKGLFEKLHLITCPVTSCSAKESTCQQKQSPYKVPHAAFQFFYWDLFGRLSGLEVPVSTSG